MKITQYKPEVQTAIRSILSSFDSISQESPNKRYSLVLAIATPVFENKTDSEIKSLVDTANRMISQLPGDSQVSLQLDIVEYSDVASKIAEKAKTNYEASSKLAGQASKLVVPEDNSNIISTQG